MVELREGKSLGAGWKTRCEDSFVLDFRGSVTLP